MGAGVYVLLLTLGPRLLNDPDSYSHIAVGRWIMAHGAMPASDPFSFSMHGAPWITFEWLSEVIYAAVYALSGWAGVVALAAAAIALAVGLLTRFLLRELSPTPALLMVVAAVMLSGAAYAGAAARADAADHGGLGGRAGALHGPACAPALLGAAAAGAVGQSARQRGAGARADRAGRARGPAATRSAANGRACCCAGCRSRRLAVAACCLTPYGPGPLLMPLTTLGLGPALGWIAEWRPQDFGHIGTFEFLLLAGIFALSRGVTLPVVRALVVLGLIHFALAQVRNADLLAMLAPLYLAAPLARQFGARAEDDAAGSARGLQPDGRGRDDPGDRAGAGARRAPGARQHAGGGRGQCRSRQGGTRAQRLFVRRLFDLRRHSHFH